MYIVRKVSQNIWVHYSPPNLNGSVAQSLNLENNCTHDMFVDIIQLTKWWPLFQAALNFIVYMTSSTVYMDINYSTVNVRVGVSCYAA